MKLLHLGLSLLCISLAACANPVTSNLKDDESLVFCPAVATWDADAGLWRATVRGIVFEPSVGRSARLKLRVLGKALQIDVGSLKREEYVAYANRADAFIVDHERGKSIVLRIGKETTVLKKSGANGHFAGEVTIPREQTRRESLRFDVVLRPQDDRKFGGVIRFLQGEGLGVISDIDDTVKDSNVINRDVLLKNTFLKPFKAVPGMSARYRDWQTKQDIYFHFVTGSPWQLFEPIQSFLKKEEFVLHDITMRHLRLVDGSLFKFLGDPRKYKIESIEAALKRFPGRKFILMGDSGEKDPEVYAAVWKKHKKQVLGFCIRAVQSEEEDPDQFQKRIADVPRRKWILFKDAKELPPDPIKWFTREGVGP